MHALICNIEPVFLHRKKEKVVQVFYSTYLSTLDYDHRKSILKP